MDKSKIAEALKEAHADFNAQTYDVVATNLANTGLVTDENLNDIVSKSKTSLQATQAENDRRASKLSKEVEKLKSQLEQKQEPKDEKPKDEPKADGKEPDVWEQRFNKLAELVERQNSSIEGLYKEKQQTSRRSQYESIYKDVKDEKFKANQLAKFDRMNFKDEDDFNSFLETETNDVKDFNQSQANENLKGNPPMNGIGGKAKPSEAEVNEIVDNMKF